MNKPHRLHQLQNTHAHNMKQLHHYYRYEVTIELQNRTNLKDVGLSVGKFVFEPAQSCRVNILLAHLRNVAEAEHFRHASDRKSEELAVAHDAHET